MTQNHQPTPPAIRRQLGRSRRYTATSLPRRLDHWHAPRANRWERLIVAAGSLEVEWLYADGTTVDTLHAGDVRWIAPGMRWRVAAMDSQASFELEIHADDAAPVSSPQAARTAWFDGVEERHVADGVVLTQLLTDLAPGEHYLLRCDFYPANHLLRNVMTQAAQSLFWHPLDRGPQHLTAFVARAAQPIGLLDYLGRDHALIEVALTGALRGNAEHARWLRASLLRHLSIEEKLLFPAYLKAHGNAGWVRGLCSEHEHLRSGLQNIGQPAGRRRFLLLLDGHDEKEEQIVYPDVLARLADQADALLTEAITYPLADGLD